MSYKYFCVERDHGSVLNIKMVHIKLKSLAIKKGKEPESLS